MLFSLQKDMMLTALFSCFHESPLITEVVPHDLPEHARIIPCVIEKSRPEPKGVFLLTDAIIRETKVNGLLQIPVLPDPVPDQG